MIVLGNFKFCDLNVSDAINDICFVQQTEYINPPVSELKKR